MERKWRLASLVMMGVYLFFALIHYFMQRPLWNDEFCVLYSIERFQTKEFFTRTLEAAQVFPRVYLLCIQKFSALFHYSILSLRALPCVAMIAGFFIWIAIARRELKGERSVFFFMASWSGAAFLVYYAAELKQYSGDVLVAALFLLFLHRQKEMELRWSKARYGALLCLLPLLGLFSYAAFLFFIFPLWNLVRGACQDRAKWLVLSGYGVSCVVTTLFIFFFDMRFRSPVYATAYSQYFISLHDPAEFLKTFTEGINSLAGRWFAEEPRWVRVPSRLFMAFAFWGMFAGWKQAWRDGGGRFSSVSTIALVVLLELFVLGVFKLYFFIVPRTVLFFCPVLLILMLQTFERMAAARPFWGRLVQGLYGTFLLVMIFGVARALLTGSLSTVLTGYLPGF